MEIQVHHVKKRPLMSLAEVAEYLNVPERTLYKWRHEGIGPRGFRVGKHVRYRPEDIEAWIGEQRG